MYYLNKYKCQWLSINMREMANEALNINAMKLSI